MTTLQTLGVVIACEIVIIVVLLVAIATRGTA
jgi:hypothetical protein